MLFRSGSDGGKYELCYVTKDGALAYVEKTRLEGVTDYSVPWNGYFEHLDGLFVESFIVEYSDK